VAYLTTFDCRGYVYSQHFTQTVYLALAIELQLPRYTAKAFFWSHTHHKIATGNAILKNEVQANWTKVILNWGSRGGFIWTWWGGGLNDGTTASSTSTRGVHAELSNNSYEWVCPWQQHWWNVTMIRIINSHMHPHCAEMGMTASEELGRQQFLLCHLLNYS